MYAPKYPNLQAEMARNNISMQQIATVLDKSRNTVTGKLSGKQPMNLDEAFKITRTFFPDKDILDLFAENQIQP